MKIGVIIEFVLTVALPQILILVLMAYFIASLVGAIL